MCFVSEDLVPLHFFFDSLVPVQVDTLPAHLLQGSFVLGLPGHLCIHL